MGQGPARARGGRRCREEGIQAVGINRIIAQADVALMTLYRQFGGKDELVAAALEQWSDQWLHWLTDRVDQCGDDPQARFRGLWDAMEEWLDAEGFRGSLIANPTAELRSKPHHPAHEPIVAHRMAMRQLLENLAKLLGATDPAARRRASTGRRPETTLSHSGRIHHDDGGTKGAGHCGNAAAVNQE